MPRHRSFQTDDRPREPVTFDIDGETFTCAASMPGSVLLEHTRRLTSGDAAVASGELLDMWRDVLDDDEHDRFRRFIDDPDRHVDIQLLGEILQYVLGEMARRPTSAPSPSAPGQSPNGATSAPVQTTPDVTSPATTPDVPSIGST